MAFTRHFRRANQNITRLYRSDPEQDFETEHGQNARLISRPNGRRPNGTAQNKKLITGFKKKH